MTDLPWLRWGKELVALAQTGLHFTKDVFDRERYERVHALGHELLGAGFAIEPAQLALLTTDRGYATPKVDVRALVRDGDGRLLLVQEFTDHRWSLPGGWADVGVSPRENAEKEVREEAGLEVSARRLLAVLERRKHASLPFPFDVYRLFFDCELLGGALAPSSETLDAAFFPLDALPPLSLARVSEPLLHRLIKLADDPAAPTEFD